MVQLKVISGKTGTCFVHSKEFFLVCIIKEIDQNISFFREDVIFPDWAKFGWLEKGKVPRAQRGFSRFQFRLLSSARLTRQLHPFNT